MSQAQDKRLWLLTDEEKEQLINILDMRDQYIKEFPGQPSKTDYLVMNLEMGGVLKDLEEKDREKFKSEIKMGLKKVAAHCLRLIKQLD